MASSTDYRIDTDSPAASDLLFWSLIGHEALSRPSVYELTVLSANPHIQAADILGRSFDVAIGFEDADGNPHERHCQGVAVRFARLHALGRYHEYRIELRSWFWLLHKRRNSRILGDDKDEGAAKNVLEILDIVLENSPIRAIKKLKSDGLGTHDARGYSVQYQESDYHYLSRLLEDEGIYYWFDAHAEPGTMRLADNAAVAHAPLPVADTLHHAPGGASEARFNDVWSWESERKLDTGWFDSRDSNYRKIRTKLGAIGADLEEHELADFEEFEFPGGYQEPDASELVAGRRMDELRSRRERHWALTGWPDVAPGCSFTYEGDPDTARNGKYLIGGCIVVAVHPGHESVPRPPSDPWAVRRMLDRALENDAVNGDTADTLRRLVDSSPSLRELVVGTRAFLVTVWPLSVPYKPPRLTPRVRMPGPQSAIVVGPKGEEIPENGEDLYVDAYGRVKVFFHWNRYEKGKKDFDGQKWTCWLRVSQPWAGKKWGGYFAPRIGQEVIVDFLDGDPDRPLITGRVYNDDQPIPYASPTQSGFKTRSTPNGKPANYNEIMFEDRKGQENINIHAERNMSRSVEVDDSTSVGHDQTIKVTNDRTVTTEGNEKREVVKDQRNIVHQHQFTNVTWNQYNNIGLHQQNIIGADGQYNHIGGKVETYIGGTQLVAVTGARTQTSASLTVNSGATTYTVGPFALGSSGQVTLTADAGRIDSTTGQHSISASGPLKTFGDTVTHGAATNMDILCGAELLIAGTADTTITGGKVNVTSLGPQKDATLGMFSKLILGLENKNNVGLVSAGVMGLKSESIMGLSLKQMALKVDDAGLHTLKPGAPGASMAALAGRLNSAMPIFQAVTAVMALRNGVSLQSDAYKKAADKLEQAAAEMKSLNADLAAKLTRLAEKARNNQHWAMANEIGGGVVAVAGAALGITALATAVPAAGAPAVPPASGPPTAPPSSGPPTAPPSSAPPTVPSPAGPPTMPPSSAPPTVPSPAGPPTVPPSSAPPTVPSPAGPPTVPPSSAPPTVPPSSGPPTAPPSSGPPTLRSPGTKP